MNIKKIVCLVFAMAVALSISATVFAYQPDTKSYLEEVGGWQKEAFNSNTYRQWYSTYCPTCGLEGYSIHIDEPLYFGDIFIIASATADNIRYFNDCGQIAYITTEEPHASTAHKAGTLFLDQYSEGGIDSIVFTTSVKNTNPFRSIIGGFRRVQNGVISPSWERVQDIYARYCNTASACSVYALTSFSVPLYEPLVDESIEEFYREAYNQGLSNGISNMSALQFIDNVFDAVSTSVSNVLDFEVLGVSLTLLMSLAVAVSLVTLIVKIIRG